MNYTPLEDRLLVQPIKKIELEKSKGGIIIPDTVKKQVCEGVVFCAGPGIYARDTGEFMPSTLKNGDTILCGAVDGKPNGLEIEIETEKGFELAYVMRESDVIMRIKKKEPE